MNIVNFLEIKYRELLSYSEINTEYSELYSNIENEKLRVMLSTLHYDFTTLFRTMNSRLPTHDNEAHFGRLEPQIASDNRNIIRALLCVKKR